ARGALRRVAAGVRRRRAGRLLLGGAGREPAGPSWRARLRAGGGRRRPGRGPRRARPPAGGGGPAGGARRPVPSREPRLTVLLGQRELYGLPLYGRLGREEWTAGLLVVTPWNAEIERAARWLARVVGHPR